MQTLRREIQRTLAPIAFLIVASCKSPSGGTEQKSENRAQTGSASPGANVASAGARASEILGTLRKRFTAHSAPNDPGADASWPALFLQEGKASGFRVADGKLLPDFATREVAALSVVLPKRSKSVVELVDRASSTRVTVSHAKSHDVEALTSDGYAVYPGAHESGATVIYAPRVDGFEDYLSFDVKPSQPAVVYELGLSHEVGGLRLVENTLEILDARGAPRLRATPPFLIGEDGRLTGATFSVDGCAVDKSPAAPWDRPLTAPGAERCVVRVSWSNDAVKYPALLDPSWSSTANTMTSARQEHTATLLTNGKVLVAGGRSGTGTAGLATAELYDPVSKTWATTGTMTGARRLHAAVQLPTSSNATTSGKVFVTGGIDGTTSATTARLY
ncbi:MAG TPA: kelch repeat-containing protein, partial [Polyangiaceae bacterium]|nr:kelch repeat-containing protein [Polyangiaceae bacterium]